MNQTFNRSIKVIICFLAFNFIATVVSLYLKVSPNVSDIQTINYLPIIASFFILFCYVYLIWRLIKNDIKALKLCFFFCLLQIVTFKTEVFSIGTNFGAKIGATFIVGSNTVTIDFLTLIIFFLVTKILIASNKQKATVN